MSNRVTTNPGSTDSSQSDIRVVLIRGAPGIGKSTLVEMLKKIMKDSAIIDVDDIRRMICDERFVYKENVHYLKAIDVVGDLVCKLSELRYRPVIVVDVFAVEALRALKQAMHGTEVFVVSLYVDDNVLIDRMKARHSGYINVDVARNVNRHIFDTRNLGNAWFNVGTLLPIEICKAVLELISYDTR